MPSIYELVNRKLNKRSTRRKTIMPRTKTIVLRPENRIRRRTGYRKRVGEYVRRRVTRRGARKFGIGGLSSINGIKNTLAPYAMAMGMGTLFVGAAMKLKPGLTSQQAQYAGLAGEYIGGGIKGTIGAEVIKTLFGLPSLLSGVLGGLGGNNSMMNSNTSTSGWA